MFDLAALQDKMTAAILNGDMSRIAPEFTHAERLSIFRNNTFSSLTEALKTTFPVTVCLADERFFAYAAHEFITAHPAREARLSVYGSEFSSFLSTFQPCRAYPVISEMAAFEWMIASSLNSAEVQALPVATIGKIASDPCARFWLQPNLRLGLSRMPLIELWHWHKREAPLPNCSFAQKPYRFAIWRTTVNLKVIALESAQFIFWRELEKGHTIESAACRAFARDPLFDLIKETLRLFRYGLVTGISPSTN